MRRICFCGKRIPDQQRLCVEHAAEYGNDPQKWEPWLKYLIADLVREYNEDYNSREINDADIEIVHRDPRMTLLERFDGDGFIVLRGCEDCE